MRNHLSTTPDAPTALAPFDGGATGAARRLVRIAGLANQARARRGASARRLLATLALLAAVPAAQADLYSDFERNDEGWRLADMASPDGGAPVFHSSIGRVQANDPYDWTAFRSPKTWAGDWTGYHHGVLSFELYVSEAGPIADQAATVALRTRSGDQLVWFAGRAPSDVDMDHFEVRLVADQWVLNPWNLLNRASGTPVEKRQFVAMIQQIDAVLINADWVSGGDYTVMDNVRVAAVPEPGTLAMAAAGLAFFAARRRLARS